MEHVTKKITNIFWYIVIHFTVLAAVGLSLVRIAMPYAENYLGTIEQWAGEKLHLDVKIAHLDSGWHGFGPALRFEGVTVSDQLTHVPLTTIDYIDVQLDVLASLIKWDWVFGRLTVDGLVATLRESSGPEGVSMVPWPLVQEFKRITVQNAQIHWPMKEGTPLVLNIIEFSVRPEKEKQRVELNMHLGDPRSRIQFIVDTHGDWMTPASMKVNGYARLKAVAFDPRYMPNAWHQLVWEQGLLSGDVWFDYDKGDWRRVIGLVNLENMIIKNRQTDKVLPFSFKGDVALEAKDEGHFHLIADDVAFSVHDKLSALTSWVVEIDTTKPWEAKFNAISLFDAVSIARMLGYLNDAIEKNLKAHDPHARLYNIEWIGVPDDPDSWHLGFQISDAYEKSEDNWPGIDNLAGTVKMTPKQGQFEVDSPNVTLVVPSVYPHALEIDSVKGLITWTTAPLQINTSKFEFVDNDMQVWVDLAMAFPEKASPEIALFVETSALTRDEVLYYLPGKVLNTSLFHWISHSFEQGEVTKATGRVEGALKDFPYENGKGVFELQFALKDTLLRYDDAWPPIEGINAQLVIDGKKFQAYIDSGHFQSTTIKQAVTAVDYSDKNKPLVLMISGDVEGPASDTEDFLKKSPLWKTMGTGMSWVDVVGTLNTRLNLQLPLDDKSIAQTSGLVSMEKGQITMPAWKIAFDNVSGSVAFENGCMKASNIQTLFLDRAATLGVSCTSTKGVLRHDWVLSSSFDMKQAYPYLSPLFQKIITGSSTYSATLTTLSNQGDSTLTLDSDLKGITVTAPAPLGKTADITKPFSIAIPLKHETSFVPVVTYDGLFNAAVAIQKEGEKFAFKGVNLMLGKEPALPPKSDGIFIGGKLSTLNVDPWLTFFDSFKQPGEKPMTVQGGFWADTLLYKGFRLDETYLSWKRLAKAWQVTFDGPGAKGIVTVPDLISVAEPLSLQFNRYVWRPNPGGDASPDTDPRLVPAINFYCEQFFYQKQSLGEVAIQVRPTANGVTFDPVTVKSDVHQFTAKGSWLHNNMGSSQTEFQGNAKTNDIAKTLAASGLKSDIEDSKSEATFDLRWTGSPGKFNKATVAGNVNVILKKGRLTAVNPGLGRLLGLFSVESIARRLQFDFSDVFQKGFAFDEFQSKITINNGTAYTSDATMKAPSANMTLTGKVGLVSQALDLDLDVKSTATSAVPTIGAAAVAIANPAVGAAMWLAGKMFNPLEGLGHYRYHVTGTWQAPVFKDISSEIVPPKQAPVKESKAS